MDEKKVAAYCRVSTDKYDQINSLENQRRYFEEYIKRQPGWELTEIYVDEGVTGTSTKRRNAFNRMMQDAAENKFDLIITKEISRFARNTLDSISYTRRLKERNIGVYFLNDNIHTLDADAELRLTIMSSIAQEESRKTSERVKWGQKRSMEKGIVFGRSLLGYNVKKGSISINPEGAEIVRLIFHKFVDEKKGTYRIAKELETAGIRTVRGAERWTNSTILKIIKNEKYCGDLLQKKTYTPNYLTHEKKRNRGAEEYVLIKNHHSPIISRELFEKAQEELKNRSNLGGETDRFSSRYAFSGKIKCEKCGCSYVSRSSRRKDGTLYKYWRCSNAVKYGKDSGCGSKAISDNLLKEITADAFALIFQENPIPSAKIMDIIETECKLGKNYGQVKEDCHRLRQKRREIYQMYIGGEINKETFAEMNFIADMKIKKLENQVNGWEKGINTEAVQKFTDNILYMKMFNESFYRNIIEKIVIEGEYIHISFFNLASEIKYQLE